MAKIIELEEKFSEDFRKWKAGWLEETATEEQRALEPWEYDFIWYSNSTIDEPYEEAIAAVETYGLHFAAWLFAEWLLTAEAAEPAEEVTEAKAQEVLVKIAARLSEIHETHGEMPPKDSASSADPEDASIGAQAGNCDACAGIGRTQVESTLGLVFARCQACAGTGTVSS